ncbi:LOW QUALITY PROTEIN: arachidonate 12-lipoxygenase, 12R-type-like [Leptodactylus fuscus]
MGSYKVTVVAGCGILAETIPTISISLIGAKEESEKMPLSHWDSETIDLSDTTGVRCHAEVHSKQDLGDLQSVRFYKETCLIDDSWYSQYIHVTAPNGTLYQFPAYQWISGKTNVLIHEGTASIKSCGDVTPEPRRRALEKNREAYKWQLFAPGVPHCIDAKNTVGLPYNEQLSHQKPSGFHVLLDSEELEAQLEGLQKCQESWKNLEDIKKVFFLRKSNMSDKVSQIWREDSFFGYQYLNGCNPMMIRKRVQIPKNFPVSDSMVAASLGTSTDLHKELQNGNIFLADYKILEGIPANDSINGKKQYMTAPMCLLWKDPQDQLRPIAIQLGQTPGDQTPIFLPSDSEWDWTLAKMWVRNADSQVHQTVYHLLHTHLFAEVFSVATYRQLPCNHPVFKLLIPHLRFTLDINNRARSDLIGPGGGFRSSETLMFTYNIMAVGKGGITALLMKAMAEVTYSGLCLPDDITARGLDSIPNYFYRDDGEDDLEDSGEGDESVRSDPELQAWVAEIYDKGFLSNPSSGTIIIM